MTGSFSCLRLAPVLGAAAVVLTSLMTIGASSQAEAQIVKTVTCPRTAPAGTDYVTVVIDLERMETYDDGDGFTDWTYEFRLDAVTSVFEFDAQGQQKKNPYCDEWPTFNFDKPVLNVIIQGRMAYSLGYQVQVTNVPITAAVYIRFGLTELDDWGDDWGDLDPSPNNDPRKSAWVALLPEKGVGIAYSTNVRDRPFDIQAGKRKRILGDGRGTLVDFKAGLEFTFTIRDQPEIGGTVTEPGIAEVIDLGKILKIRENSCRDYALKSVEQNLQSIKLGCNYPPPDWSNDHQMHFDWCMQGNNLNQAAIEIDKRKVALATCAQGNSPDQVCRNYADRSVAQFVEAQKRNCDIAPPSWSADWNAHFGWCLVVGGNTATPELAKRDTLLAACRN